MVRACLADQAGRPEDTHRLLLDAVEPVAAADPELAAEMLLWVVEAGWAARDRAVVEHAAATADALRLPGPPLRAHAALAIAQLEDDPDAALPDAVAALAQLAGCSGEGSPRATASLALWHLLLGADTTAHELATAAERESRAAGTLGVLPRVLAALATARWHLGRWPDAAATASEGLRIARDTGQDQSVGELSVVLAHVAAAEGDEVRTAAVLADLDGRRLPPEFGAVAASARSLLDLGLGRFEAAADRLAEATTCPRLRRSLPDLVEAAVRSGRPAEALDATGRFERWAGHTGETWARAVALRCRALLHPGDAAATLFAEAAALHRADGEHPFERARTDLLHGEWLRRARRRSEARGPLRAAVEAFEELGARPWADRARAELRATGETRTVAGPGRDVLADLTPQEMQVVRLAAAGLSNRDIGAQLFLSPRTVGYHLYKAFPKLGVASRAQLVRLDLPA
jgi:DNA-binding CsgD family transcriptional regulator